MNLPGDIATLFLLADCISHNSLLAAAEYCDVAGDRFEELDRHDDAQAAHENALAYREEAYKEILLRDNAGNRLPDPLTYS